MVLYEVVVDSKVREYSVEYLSVFRGTKHTRMEYKIVTLALL